MANQLDEMNEVIMEEGRDVNVIAKQIPVVADKNDVLAIYGFGFAGVLVAMLGAIMQQWILVLAGLGGAFYVFKIMKDTDSFFNQLEQKIQQQASQIDNYLENRVVILENTARLVQKAIDLDKELLTEVAALRSGIANLNRNELNSSIENISRQLNIVVENYPDIKSHAEIRDAIQQNAYLQKEITAARDLYNDVVYSWNREIFEWPFKKVVASRRGLTTRIPFIASKEMKEKARKVFF